MTEQEIIAAYPHLKPLSLGKGDSGRLANKNIRAHLKSLGFSASVRSVYKGLTVTLPFGSEEKRRAAVEKALEKFEGNWVMPQFCDYGHFEGTQFTKTFGGGGRIHVCVAYKDREQEREEAKREKEARQANEAALLAKWCSYSQVGKNLFIAQAVRDGKVTDVRRWCRAGADPNTLGVWLFASRKENVTIALIDAGVDVNTRCVMGRTLLHWWQGSQYMCERLVRLGADPRAVDKHGRPPCFGNVEVHEAQRVKLESMADARTAELDRQKMEADVPSVQGERVPSKVLRL